MSDSIIYFDGGGSGIRAKSSGSQRINSNFDGFSHGEISLVDYLADVVINFSLEVTGEISRAVLAVATLPSDDNQFNLLANKILTNSKVRELWICSDSVSSCAGAVDDDGVVIAAGTGITALAVGRKRTMLHSLSGDGFLIGDEASAFWIGKMGLSSALRSRDGRGGDSELLDVACKYFDSEPYFLMHKVHQSERPVAAIAAFATKVSELAKQGNAACLSILDAAADEIVLIALTAKRECAGDENFQIALVGGVLSELSIVYQLVEDKLNKLGLKIYKNGRNSLDGAEVLAQSSTPDVFAPLIRIFKAGQ